MLRLLLVALTSLILSVPAYANFTIESPELDVTQMGTYVTAILTGLAAIWLARKFIKVTNRS